MAQRGKGREGYGNDLNGSAKEMKRTAEHRQGIALRGRETLRKAMEKPCWDKPGNAKERNGKEWKRWAWKCYGKAWYRPDQTSLAMER